MPAQMNSCMQFDAELAKFTVMRYVVLATVIGCRVLARTKKADRLLGWPLKVFQSSCEFIVTEGVGLTIYFAVSAVMDNFTIFLVTESYCAYVKMAALYTMAVLTFLPNAMFAYWFQSSMYDKGNGKQKVTFVVIIVLMTAAFFGLRLLLVYGLGYAEFIGDVMSTSNHKVAIAALVPPAVDGVQSALLIASSRLAAHYSPMRGLALDVEAGDATESSHPPHRHMLCTVDGDPAYPKV